MNAVQMLDRILDPVTDTFTLESARELVAITPDATFQSRLDELAEKSNSGQLSNDERQEYRDYIGIVDVISILQAKARLKLAADASDG